MGLFDSVFDLVGNLFTGKLNNDAAEDRQEAAQEFSAQQYASRYQTTVKDMTAAGLNPALAYGGISGSPPTSSAASSAGYPALGSSWTERRKADAAIEVADAQTANIKADSNLKGEQAKLAEAQAIAARASAGQADANVGLISESVRKIRAEIPQINENTTNLQKQREVMSATANMLAEQANLMKQQGQSQALVREHLVAMIAKLSSETALNQFDIDAALQFENSGRYAKEIKPIIDILRMVLGRGR